MALEIIKIFLYSLLLVSLMSHSSNLQIQMNNGMGPVISEVNDVTRTKDVTDEIKEIDNVASEEEVVISNNEVPESANTQPFNFQTRLMHSGRLYIHNKTYVSKKGTTYYYRCSDYDCHGKLRVYSDTSIFAEIKKHSCIVVEALDHPLIQQANMSAVELHIKKTVEFNASIPSMTPQAIFETVLLSLSTTFPENTYAIPLKKDIKSMVKRFRTSNILDLDKLKEPPLCKTISGYQFFKGNINMFLGKSFLSAYFWSSVECTNLLTQCDQIFIDATFKCVPKPFKQLLIIMGHHKCTRVHFPSSFVLMDSKSEDSYKYVLSAITSWIGKSAFPKIVTCDFELSLINAISDVFPQGIEIVGCYFHFKQAVKRKFEELGCPRTELPYVMGLVGILTVVEKDAVELAFAYVEEKLLARNLDITKKMALEKVLLNFKSYFIHYWIPKFEFWNIHRFLESSLPNIKRTNNCLERYNRRLNSKFPIAHPKIIQFVSTLRQEESYYTQYIRSIMAGSQILEEAPHEDFPMNESFQQWIMEKTSHSSTASQSSPVHINYNRSDNISETSRSMGYILPCRDREVRYFNEDGTAAGVAYFGLDSADLDDLENSPDENLLPQINSCMENVMSDREMRAYVMNIPKCRVENLRAFLTSKGIQNFKLKKVQLVEEIKRYFEINND
jgi:hypothetical protein